MPQSVTGRCGARGCPASSGSPTFASWKLADQRRQHVARLQVEVVAGSVQVRRHQREVVGAVLAVQAPAELDAGDLGDRVGAVGLFERARQQVLLTQRLRGLARVDAARAEEDEAPHAAGEGGADEVRLDQQVLVDELPGLLPVRHDAADLGGGDDHGVGLLRLDRRVRRRLVGHVDVGDVARDDVGEPGLVAGRDGSRRRRGRCGRRGRCALTCRRARPRSDHVALAKQAFVLLDLVFGHAPARLLGRVAGDDRVRLDVLGDDRIRGHDRPATARGSRSRGSRRTRSRRRPRRSHAGPSPAPDRSGSRPTGPNGWASRRSASRGRAVRPRRPGWR